MRLHIERVKDQGALPKYDEWGFEAVEVGGGMYKEEEDERWGFLFGVVRVLPDARPPPNLAAKVLSQWGEACLASVPFVKGFANGGGRCGAESDCLPLPVG